MSKVVGAKSHKTFVGPVISATYIVALLPSVNRANVIDLLRSYKVFPAVVLFFILFLPIVIIVVYWLRRKNVDARLRTAGDAQGGEETAEPAQGS
jgi:hypothetical protein